MMTHQTSVLARKADDRKDLERRVQQHLAAGGSLSTLPYLARSQPRMPKDYQSEAPRVRGIAAESRAKKRAADKHAITFSDLLRSLERPMKKRKPNNPKARLARNCRALLANSQVAVMNIDRPDHPDLVDQRLISLRDGKPIALSQVQMVADAFCDFAYPWTVYFAAMCRDQQGAQYIKAEEIALSGIHRADQLTSVLDHFCRKLQDGCNTRHLVSSGWIANTSGIGLDEARAYELFEKFGAWAQVEQSRGAA